MTKWVQYWLLVFRCLVEILGMSICSCIEFGVLVAVEGLEKARLALKDLKFEAKQGIVRTIVDRVVGKENQLQVYGYIPVTNINVFTSYRYRRSSKRR